MGGAGHAGEWGWRGLTVLKSGRTLHALEGIDRTDLYSEVRMVFQMGDVSENEIIGDK